MNCRVSYESLARSLNITANSVKRRINNLVETGAIDSFQVRLSHAMADVEPVLALAEVLDTKRSDEIVSVIGNHPHVTRVGFDSYRWLIIWAEYNGTEGLADLSSFLRSLKGIGEVEMNPLINRSRGKKVEFTKAQLRIIKVLLDDPRMPISKIALESGMTTKRVRKLLNELIEGEGVVFTARQNINSGDTTRYVLRLSWDEKITNAQEIQNWLQKEYPEEFWFALITASEARMFAVFISEHIRRADVIAKHLSDLPGVNYHVTSIPYPAKLVRGVRDTKLREMIASIDNN